jgi:hypothetical protein
LQGGPITSLVIAKRFGPYGEYAERASDYAAQAIRFGNQKDPAALAAAAQAHALLAIGAAVEALADKLGELGSPFGPFSFPG